MGRRHEDQPGQRITGRHGQEVRALKRIATALVALGALLLSGCAQLPAGNAIQRSPPVLTQFELDGRIVVRESQSRHYANISWRHDAQRDEILLTTPLGQGVAELTRDSQGARLVMADRKEYVADDWAGLSEQVFGTRLPLDDLPQWLSGRAPPAASGWRVEYLEYQSDAADALPTLIEATRADVGLRIKVSEWLVAK